MTSEDSNFYRLVGRRTDDHITPLSEELADGGRAVLVFCEKDAAEAFRTVEDLGEEWEVIEGAGDEVIELLGVCDATGVQYVCLDPPTSRTRNAEREPRLVPLRAFLDHLLDHQGDS